jgi:hypothetical protein
MESPATPNSWFREKSPSSIWTSPSKWEFEGFASNYLAAGVTLILSEKATANRAVMSLEALGDATSKPDQLDNSLPSQTQVVSQREHLVHSFTHR